MIKKQQLPQENRYLTYEQLNLIVNLQRMWQALAFSERDLIFSVFRDAERIPTVANRIYNDSVPNFYNAFRLYYGGQIAQEISNDIADYTTNLWRLAQAISENDTEGANKSTADLYQVVDRLASFLSRINLYWSEQQWKNLLYQHTKTKIQEILAVASDELNREYELFDQVLGFSAIMGDYMARGIISNMVTSLPENQDSFS